MTSGTNPASSLCLYSAQTKKGFYILKELLNTHTQLTKTVCDRDCMCDLQCLKYLPKYYFGPLQKKFTDS